MYPVILLSIYKDTTVFLYYANLFFCLLVCFRLKYNRKLFFDVKKIIKQRPELGYKTRFTITNDGVEKAVVLCKKEVAHTTT